ncbi:MAG: M23 family metallopeptidase [Acidimicrobiia bacterium]|nr:M23 family metallopeptidase [Acidimicrobiia bacterium]
MTRRTPVLAAVLAVFVALPLGVANAQVDTSTTVPQTVAPTTLPATIPPTLPPVTLPPATVPPVAPPPPKAATTSTSTTTTTTPPASVGADEAAAFPERLARSGASSTAALLDALKPLETLGFSREEAIKLGFGHLPVGGMASYTDDFGDFRAGPPVHAHEGNDIFAAYDTPIRAPFDGVVRFVEEGGLGGRSIYVTTADGTEYYNTHVNSFAPDVASGSAVTQGQVLGGVGDTGNAKGTSPHDHFEIHRGGVAVDPKPILDAWLAEAIAAAPKLAAGAVQDQPAVLQSTGLTRRFDLSEVDHRVQAPVEPLLWAASVSPAGSALRLAQVEAARMAEGIDWEERAARAVDQATARRRSEGAAVAFLWRLTPELLSGVVGGPGS